MPRKKLPDERRSITHKFEIENHEGYLIVGLYEDGSPGEVFIKVSKEGSTLSGLLNTIGASISIGLQNGVALSEYVAKFKNTRFQPNGLTSNENISEARSIIDYVMRYLEQKFLEE